MSNQWFIKPHLQKNELFSSWLVRAALKQGCDPLILTNSIWPNWRIWTIDRDRKLTEEQLKPLIAVLDKPSYYFDQAFLYPIASLVTAKNLSSCAIWPWMLCYGVRNRRTHAGIQYCPACIRADKDPYYRVNWRYAWNVVCTEHNCHLLDECQQCFKPIQIQRISTEQKSLAYCFNCNKHICDNKNMKVCFSSSAKKVQLFCNRITHKPSSFTTKHRHELFKKLYCCISLIRYSQRTKSLPLITLFNELGINAFHNKQPKNGLAFELLTTSDRYSLLEQASTLFFTPDRSLIRLFKKTGVSYNLLRSINTELPANLGRLAKIELPSNNKNNTNKISSTHKRPKTITAVKRMHALLVRKYNSY